MHFAITRVQKRNGSCLLRKERNTDVFLKPNKVISMTTLNRPAGLLPWLMALLCSFVLAACGGGGQDPVLGTPPISGPVVISVAVSPAAATVPMSSTQAFVATATYSDGSTRDVTALSTWSSATTSVSTVAPTTGLASAAASGTSVITATFGGQSSTANLTVSSATLVSLAISPATALLPISGTQAFVATASYSDGSTRDVSSSTVWSSGASGVGTIGASTGLATGVASGTSVITAAFGGKTNTSLLSVTTATLASVAVSPASTTVPVNGTQPYQATATYTDSTTRDVTSQVTWASASTSVATIASSGLARGVTSGTSSITASLNGKTGTASLNVTAASLVSVAITPSSATVQLGQGTQLVVKGTYSDSSVVDLSSSALWTSATPSVATVIANSGAVKAVSSGSATITASVGGKSATALITVPASSLVSVAVTPAMATVAVGAGQGFVATGTYSDNTTVNLTATAAWSSDATAVATVLNTGVATGKSVGTAMITATASGKSGSASLQVVAAPPVAMKGPAAVNLGTAANFVALAKTGISTTGTTSIVGDIGVSPAAASFITGFGLIADSSNTFSTSPQVSGKVYAADYAAPTPAYMTTAISDMQTAFTDAAGRSNPDFTELYAGDISGRTLVPGLYKWGTGVLVTSAGVTLSGGANDVWIFQIAQDFTVSNSAVVTLIGGAQARNVFWQVSGKATLGTGAALKGNLLSQTLISLSTGASITGRVLAQTAVTLDAAKISAP